MVTFAGEVEAHWELSQFEIFWGITLDVLTTTAIPDISPVKLGRSRYRQSLLSRHLCQRGKQEINEIKSRETNHLSAFWNLCSG